MDGRRTNQTEAIYKVPLSTVFDELAKMGQGFDRQQKATAMS